MRSEIEWADEWIDLSSLTEFKGDLYNFHSIGSVILESMDLAFDWLRYPSIIIQWNQFRWLLLRLHLFPPILKYSFSHFLIIRCCCSRISHQTQKQLRQLTESVSYQHNKWTCVNVFPNKHGLDLRVDKRRGVAKKRYELDAEDGKYRNEERFGWDEWGRRIMKGRQPLKVWECGVKGGTVNEWEWCNGMEWEYWNGNG